MKENVKFLHRVFIDLRARGLRIRAVGKAYDELYICPDGGCEEKIEYMRFPEICFHELPTIGRRIGETHIRP